MSYSFKPLDQSSRTLTRWGLAGLVQSVFAPVTVKVKTSQLTPSTQAATVLTPPPGFGGAVCCHVAAGPVGPTLPELGFCARLIVAAANKIITIPAAKKNLRSLR